MLTEQLVEILCIHNQRYPRWQPQDSLKLLHQAEFGGGHLIINPAENERYLREEWHKQNKDASHLFLEEVGNDYFRVYLSAYKGKGGKLERLQRAFLLSSQVERVKETSSIEEDLNCLLQCAKQGCFHYAWSDLEREIQRFQASGYAMLRHSPVYRELYQPSYRVIHRQFLHLL